MLFANLILLYSLLLFEGPKVGILEKGRKTALQGDALEMLRV